MARTYKVFISHSWGHDDALQSLKNIMESRGYFLLNINKWKNPIR